MQKEITQRQPLLGRDGNIVNPGYAKKLLWDYNRENITASKARIKEWDYYYVGCDEHALCLTVADMGYVGALSISVMDFVTPSQFTNSSVFLFPMGKLNMPRTTEHGDVHWRNGKTEMTFTCDGKTRRLFGTFHNADKKGNDVRFDVTLTDFPEESMVIATPFDKPGHFYYNQKINCMRASGAVTLGDKTYTFLPEDSFGTLDWGRGVWTYHNTWYWGSASGLADGVPFGFNIGYGFGDTSAATENMLFYAGKAHKLSRVAFHIPQKGGRYDYMANWTFTSDDGRFEMDFQPILDRAACTSVGVLKSDQHQVFGRFNGRAVLDDGTAVELRNFMGFAERVENKW